MRTNQSLRPERKNLRAQLFHLAAPRDVTNAAADFTRDVERKRKPMSANGKIARVRTVEVRRIQAAIAVVVGQLQHRIKTFGTLRFEGGHKESSTRSAMDLRRASFQERRLAISARPKSTPRFSML